jgi:hypothetical protein
MQRSRFRTLFQWIHFVYCSLRAQGDPFLQVKMAGAAGIVIDKLDVDESILRLRNRRRVQNHIGGVHAAATALLAESATGAVFAMNVRRYMLILFLIRIRLHFQIPVNNAAPLTSL